jgi:filamentous hemagglutinin family protein
MPTKSLPCSTLQRVFKKKPLCLAISALLTQGIAHSAPVLNDPAGTKIGGVTVGSAAISQKGNVTTVNQTSSKAAINWWSFSTAPGETVNFVQPNSSSITLNRVIGNEKSVLQGALNANGKVFLINSNGVLITKGATINAAGFIASTLNLSDEDFRKGKYTFRSNGTSASVVNQGEITVANGGYVALLGNVVSNEGTITATKGTVSLNSGNKITLNFNGDSMLSVTIDEGTLNALIENKGAIYADGGQVIMTAKAADDLLSAQVNNTGIVQARTIDDLKGNIEIYAHGGTANIDGTLDASAPTSGDGGFIETSGDKVKIANSAKILTKSAKGKNGKWLIDPVDFTIAASGGDMTGAFLSNYLNTQGDYEVQSAHGSTPGSGDINVNDAVTWNSDNMLTLTAIRDVNINNAITINGANGKLTMNYGGDYNIRTKASYSGTTLDANGKPIAKQDTSGGLYGSVTFTNAANTNGLTINTTNYTLIHSVDQLAANNDTTGNKHYAIAQDLTDTAGTRNGALITNLGTASTTGFGLDPDGNCCAIVTTPGVASTLAGLGHTISNLNVDTANAQYSGALIGQVNSSSTVRDIGLINTTLNSRYSGAQIGYAGALAGFAQGTISHVYASGGTVTTSGNVNTAGLIGKTSGAGVNTTIDYSYSNISGVQAGLIAYMESGGSVKNSHATGNVSGGGQLGGLIGWARSAEIADSYATGDVIGTNTSTNLGGLVGQYDAESNLPNQIRNTFATGDVVGGTILGGLIGGISRGPLTIYNSHASGNVTANYPSTISTEGGVGGLIGSVGNSISSGTVNIDRSSASGTVTVNTGNVNYVGGLVGFLTSDGGSTITNSQASGNVNAGQSSYVGGLAGWLYGTNLDNVSATGDVTGNNVVGGLAGYFVQGNIDNSYTSGNITSNTPSSNIGYTVGALIGQAGQANIGDKVFYRGDLGLPAIGNAQFASNVVNKGSGLTKAQLADIRFYLDGTIGTVLAQRELSADAVLQASETIQAAQRNAAFSDQHVSVGNRPPSIDSLITFADSQDYSAGVRSITVDGVRFDLEDEKKSNNDKN